MKKYKLIKKDYITLPNGTKSYRIQAMCDFGSVKKEEIGGYVESKNNLSHDGLCWVSGNAQVSGNARVSGNAWVSGDACVSGDAWEKSPLYIQGTKAPLTNCKYGYIQIGCICKTIKDWEKDYKKIGEENGYSDSEIKEYGEYIKLFKKVGK